MEKELEKYVREYIEEEINYIENEVDYRDKAINEKAYKEDLEYLKSLNENNISKIASKVRWDADLEETIKELIHRYLYN